MHIKYLHRKVGMETTKGSLVLSYLLQILDWVESGTGLVHCTTPTDIFFKHRYTEIITKEHILFFLFSAKLMFINWLARIFISVYPSRMSKWSTNHLVAWNDSLWMILVSKSLDKIWRSFEELEPSLKIDGRREENCRNMK